VAPLDANTLGKVSFRSGGGGGVSDDVFWGKIWKGEGKKNIKGKNTGSYMQREKNGKKVA
jgi:hypothetical protein